MAIPVKGTLECLFIDSLDALIMEKFQANLISDHLAPSRIQQGSRMASGRRPYPDLAV
jgi:hypothetical protein